MSVGFIIHIFEIIITVAGGVILIVGPCEMRWNCRMAKILVVIAVVAAVGVKILNAYWIKFSSIECIVGVLYFFVVVKLFWRINTWQLILYDFLYWYTIMLIQYMAIYVSCYFQRTTFVYYIHNENGLLYYWIHVLGMCVVVTGVVLLLYFRRNKTLIPCHSRRDCIYLLGMIVLEEIVQDFVFNAKAATAPIHTEYMMFIILIFWVLLSSNIILIIVKMCREAQYQRQMLNMNMEDLEQQHRLMLNSYEEKRKQIHDAMNHDLVVMGMLKEKQVDSAIHYLEAKMQKSAFDTKNKYTGLLVIDIILSAKIAKAEEFDIRVKLDADVLFCPVNETEICIVIGNLLDNAIEAVRELEEKNRYINIATKTTRNLFLLDVSNPYEGKRKKRENEYLTTKANSQMHGFGLASVKKIISDNDGKVAIKDDGSIFRVEVTLYNYTGTIIQR